MKYDFKELLNQGVIVILFGGAIGVFSGFFMSMQSETNETHRTVQEMKIRQEVDRQVIIESIAELHTKMDEIKRHPVEKEEEWLDGQPLPMLIEPQEEENLWDDFDKNRSKMQQRFSKDREQSRLDY